MASIELRQVKKTYGALDVIKGIDLDIKHGEFCVFVGPSGCGKSTLLRMISGLEELSGGDIVIGGDVVNAVPAADRGLAMVFQSYALYPHMTVRENLSFGLENIGTPKKDIVEKVSQVSKMLQIDQLLERRPKDLSGGQRQRVAIGRAVVREPRVFLFDEPLSNLDAELRVDMRGEISSLHRRLGNTMIYVTHDQVEAMTMADKIVVLRDGRIMQVGRPLDLYNNPANQFVAGFIGSPKMNFLSAKVASGDSSNRTIEVAGQRILLEKPVAAEEGEPLTFGIRPEHVNPQAQSASLGDASIQLVEHLGGSTVVYTSTPDGQPATLLLDGQRHIRIGETIPFAFDLAKTHLFGADGRRI